VKIVLICDAPMNVNTGGIGQTLYNILSFVQPKDLLCIAPIEEVKITSPSFPFASRYLTYRYKWLTAPRNRLGVYIQPIAQWFNYSVCQLRKFRKVKKAIHSFEPDIIVLCPNSPVDIILYEKLVSNQSVFRNVFPYFMDDWMYKRKTKWIGGSLHIKIREFLRARKKWLMIGKELADIVRERYQIDPEEIFYVRNPVDLNNVPDSELYKKGDPFIIAYAGALWDMHYNSFYAFAQAVHILTGTINVQLVLYTLDSFWVWRKPALEPLGVRYGGHVDYSQIHGYLHQADALLVTSSFSEEVFTHSKGSLQTKITDYLKSARLIISCGPAYSANHRFLKENQCGVCIETSDPEKISLLLTKVIQNIDSYQKFVKNGSDVLKKEFSMPVVHDNLKQFLLQNSVR
jgi:glycosyltransferase involved in cell wall biosynthesis